MAKNYHMGMSVRGALRRTNKELRGIFRHQTEQRSMTPDEAREFLMDALKAGHEVIPCSACDNFDYSGPGCQGHETPNAVLTGAGHKRQKWLCRPTASG
jgi:hypothetical protein